MASSDKIENCIVTFEVFSNTFLFENREAALCFLLRLETEKKTSSIFKNIIISRVLITPNDLPKESAIDHAIIPILDCNFEQIQKILNYDIHFSNKSLSSYVESIAILR